MMKRVASAVAVVVGGIAVGIVVFVETGVITGAQAAKRARRTIQKYRCGFSFVVIGNLTC